MATLFGTSAIAVLIIGFMLIQSAALPLLRKASGLGPKPVDWIYTSIAGSGMTLALGAALQQAHWIWVAAGVCVGLAGHVAHLILHWKPET